MMKLITLKIMDILMISKLDLMIYLLFHFEFISKNIFYMNLSYINLSFIKLLKISIMLMLKCDYSNYRYQ